MGLFVLDLWWSVNGWPHRDGMLMNWREFLSLTAGDRIIVDLLGIAIAGGMFVVPLYAFLTTTVARSEEHTSELQSLMRISYAVFCLKKKNTINYNIGTYQQDSDKRSAINLGLLLSMSGGVLYPFIPY